MKDTYFLLQYNNGTIGKTKAETTDSVCMHLCAHIHSVCVHLCAHTHKLMSLHMVGKISFLFHTFGRKGESLKR